MTILVPADSLDSWTLLYRILTYLLIQREFIKGHLINPRVAQPIVNFIHKKFLEYFNTVKQNKIFIKGESGIRTHGTRKGSSDFKSDAIDQLCHLAKKISYKTNLKF